MGKPLTITNGNGVDVSGDASHKVNINPIRYRGYYYDTETGLFYVGSRYYDPEIGRFISPEPNVDYGGFDEGAGLLAYNVYAYCANNPVMYKDETGESITLTCIIVFGIIGAVAGGYAGYKIAQHYEIPKGQRWKYVLGGVVIGGAAGALLGWGVGIGVSAAAVKIAGTALFGKAVTSGGMLIGLATQFFEKTKNAMNLSQVKHLITLCQKYGVDITARLVDLTKGHGAWSGIPHIHIGDKQIHIALTKEAVAYIRQIFGI